MEDQDKKQFESALKTFLFTLHGTHSPPAGTVRHYWLALKDQPLATVVSKLDEIGSQAIGHVTPGECAQLISGKKKSSGKDAWDFYMTYLKRNGVMGMSADVCDDPKAQKALKAVGGARMLNVSPGDQSSIRSAFYEAYDKQ